MPMRVAAELPETAALRSGIGGVEPIHYNEGEFHATDATTDYAVEFLKHHQRHGRHPSSLPGLPSTALHPCSQRAYR